MSFSRSRRKFLQAGAAVAAAGALGVVGDATFFEANRPKVVSIDIPLSRLPQSWDGLRIAQLSDLHYDPHFSAVPIAKAVDLVNGLKPDLIVVTGDFVTSPFSASRSSNAQAAKMIEPCSQLLSRMQAPLGVHACLGNHDVATDEAQIAAVLESHGISVLRNRSIPLERNGARLWLGGLNDVLEGKYDLKQALKGVPKPEPVVLLVHEPDYAGYVKDVDLQLSGHSHGGQIRFPILGAPVLPVMGRRYPQGLRRIGPLTLYTNVGIGTIWLPMRLNCPPEVTLITLRASAV